MQWNQIHRRASVKKALLNLNLVGPAPEGWRDYDVWIEVEPPKALFAELYERQLLMQDGVGPSTIVQLKRWLGDIQFKQSMAPELRHALRVLEKYGYKAIPT